MSPPSGRARPTLFALVVAAALPFDAAADPTKLALLVGCTEYRNNDQLRELYGPANDVPMWAALLTDPNGFAFPKENVTQLLGWPADPGKRPTRANIASGFESLIANAGPGSRVVVVMSGHGVQVPIPDSQKDPLDPKNPEPDGLDEVFLPADVTGWERENGLAGAITDDQVGAWLDRLRDKGAHVLIVFDCCHSGTMTRGAQRKGEPDPNTPEVSRTADPKALGVTPEMLGAASARAKEAVEAAVKSGRPLPAPVKVAEKAGRGSLVAFYAAQPFEEAPELPLPAGKPVVRENYFGMLSFTLVQAIRQRQSGLSYGELQRLVAAQYRAARATRPPTPFAEGDLNREVLGLTAWPNRPTIYLQRDARGRLTVDAGALHGLTEKSVLSVAKPGSGPDGKQPLGYAVVESVQPATAVVSPVAFEGKPAFDPAELTGLARCEVARKDFGDMQVRVSADDAGVRAALEGLGSEVGPMVKLVGEAEAEWVLRRAKPAEARKEFGLSSTAEEVYLVQGLGRTPDPRGEAKPRKVFGRYPAGDAGALLGALKRDLPKVFTWQNVWRIAGGVTSAEGGETHGLKVEVVKLKNEDAKDGEVLKDGRLKNGQEVLFRAKNEGRQDLWVSAFYLDANLGIKVVYSGGVGRGKTVKLNQGTAESKGDSAGREGLVVFALPQTAGAEPNFAVIEQEPLNVADGTRGGPVGGQADNPFSALLTGAAVKGGTRAFTPRVNSTPAILTQSWLLEP